MPRDTKRCSSAQGRGRGGKAHKADHADPAVERERVVHEQRFRTRAVADDPEPQFDSTLRLAKGLGILHATTGVGVAYGTPPEATDDDDPVLDPSYAAGASDPAELYDDDDGEHLAAYAQEGLLATAGVGVAYGTPPEAISADDDPAKVVTPYGAGGPEEGFANFDSACLSADAWESEHLAIPGVWRCYGTPIISISRSDSECDSPDDDDAADTLGSDACTCCVANDDDATRRLARGLGILNSIFCRVFGCTMPDGRWWLDCPYGLLLDDDARDCVELFEQWARAQGDGAAKSAACFSCLYVWSDVDRMYECQDWHVVSVPCDAHRLLELIQKACNGKTEQFVAIHIQRTTTSEGGELMKSDADIDVPSEFCLGDSLYRVTAVIVHLGSEVEGGGKRTNVFACYVWYDQWWYVSDNTVRSRGTERPKELSKAYMVFARRLRAVFAPHSERCDAAPSPLTVRVEGTQSSGQAASHPEGRQ